MESLTPSKAGKTLVGIGLVLAALSGADVVPIALLAVAVVVTLLGVALAV